MLWPSHGWILATWLWGWEILIDLIVLLLLLLVESLAELLCVISSSIILCIVRASFTENLEWQVEQMRVVFPVQLWRAPISWIVIPVFSALVAAIEERLPKRQVLWHGLSQLCWLVLLLMLAFYTCRVSPVIETTDSNWVSHEEAGLSLRRVLVVRLLLRGRRLLMAMILVQHCHLMLGRLLLLLKFPRQLAIHSLFLLKQFLEEAHLRLQLVHLIERALLEVLENLNLRVERFDHFRVPLQLFDFWVQLFPEHSDLLLHLSTLLLVFHD